MGTSTCHRSPSTSLPWRFANVGYQNPGVTNDQLVRDIFIAVKATNGEEYVNSYSLPSIYSFVKMANTIKDPKDIEINADNEIVKNKDASIYVDIAKRALVKTITKKEKGENYISNLFAETAEYLVSRDVSGYLGSEKIKKVKDIIKLKQQVRNIVIKESKKVKTKIKSERDLRTHVHKIINNLIKK